MRQHKKGDKVEITPIAIQKVKFVKPKYMNSKQADIMRNNHRELLTFSMLENNSNEVAAIYSIDKKARSNFYKGDKSSVNIEESIELYHLLRTSNPQTLELLHNHPGLSYFSMQDLWFFMEYDSIKTMTVVTNTGNVWYISKNGKFNKNELLALMRKIYKSGKENYDEIIEIFLKSAYHFGIERN